MEQVTPYKGKITPSIVSAILGSDPLQSRTDIMRSMVRKWHKATPEGKKNGDSSCDQEQLLIAKTEFEAKTGMVVSDGGFYTHPDNSLFAASIFGFLSDDIVMILCYPSPASNVLVNAKAYLENNRTHYDKVQFQLHCAYADICHFIVKTPQGIDSTAVTRDDYWMKSNKNTLNRFLADFLKIVNSKKLTKPYCTEWEYNADEDEEWLSLAQERVILKSKLDELNKALKKTNDKLIAFAQKKDCKVSGSGIQAFKMVRKGAIQYAKISELKDINMDKYRKKDAEYWTVR
jgi:hypothetical protein